MTLTFAFNISLWKRQYFELYFPERQFVFVPISTSFAQLKARWIDAIIALESVEIMVWGTGYHDSLMAYARNRGITVYHLEDGFIRNLSPRSSKSMAISLTLDRYAPYFDARQPTELEILINQYDFEHDFKLRRRAEVGLARFIDHRITKYNTDLDYRLRTLTKSKIVLVLGQVEDDASITYGCKVPISNRDLVHIAKAEQPGAFIVFKPHPDTILGKRRLSTNNSEIANLCYVMKQPANLGSVLDSVDHVYTITSLGGFEAVLRGLKVTVLGSPFYSGWGLTDDRQPTQRRGRKLGIVDLFAAVYLLYPKYFEPQTGAPSTFEMALNFVVQSQLNADLPVADTLFSGKQSSRAPLKLQGVKEKILGAVIRMVAGKQELALFAENPRDYFRNQRPLIYRILSYVLYPLNSRRDEHFLRRIFSQSSRLNNRQAS